MALEVNGLTKVHEQKQGSTHVELYHDADGRVFIRLVFEQLPASREPVWRRPAGWENCQDYLSEQLEKARGGK